MDLLDYRGNNYSQNGEDGIIEKILSILKIENGFFVEFGAADGKMCSNTWNLVERGWSGLYIEGLESYYNECSDNIKPYSNVKCINKYVDYKGDNTLDNILKESNVIYNFDILSIDIDSYDYHVWKSLEKFKPKIVIIEINSSIPEGHYQIHNPPEEILTSFSSMVDLGVSKGYKPLCHTGNLIFIDSEIEFEEVNFYQLKNWIGLFNNPYKQTN